MHDPVALNRLEKIADRMDNMIRVPGTQIHLGLDAMLGLIPGIGDVAALGPAGYIIYRAGQMGASKPVIARMTWNTAIDTAIGTIPLIGDIFDIGNKSNKKNVTLLRRHLEKKKGAQSDAQIAA